MRVKRVVGRGASCGRIGSPRSSDIGLYTFDARSNSTQHLLIGIQALSPYREPRSLSLCGRDLRVRGLACFSYCFTPDLCSTGFSIDHSKFVNRSSVKIPLITSIRCFSRSGWITYCCAVALRRKIKGPLTISCNLLFSLKQVLSNRFYNFTNLYLYVDFYDGIIKVQMNQANRSQVTFTRKCVNEFDLVYIILKCPSVFSD